MSKDTVTDWDTNANNNTDIGGINIAESCPAPNLNNAQREMMAQIAEDVPTNVSNRGFIYGLETAPSSGDATNDITVSAGSAASDAALPKVITLAASITKQIDAAWAVGDDNGGLDTGSVSADATYHLFLIQRSDTGVVDALFSLSATAPLMPANYDRKRRIGAVVRSSGAILPFQQNGDRFDLVAPITVFAAAPGATTASILPLDGIPTGLALEAIIRGNIFEASGNNSLAYISPIFASDIAPAAPNAVTAQSGASGSAGSYGTTVMTNTSAQVRLRVSTTTVIVSVGAYGWFDRRGR